VEVLRDRALGETVPVRFKDPRLAWAVLGLAMLGSLAVCIYVTRGTTFSADELTWVAFSPDMDLKVALEPHSGHLVLVSHLVYKFLLETIGTGYLVFRLLTLFSVFLAVGLFFVWARRRVGDWLALAPCLVLLFFGSDTGHLLQGNGFTIMLALACGMAALVGLDRDSRGGDLFACAALVLGTITYTVALPFIVGAAVIVLAKEGRWRRSWIFLIPVAVYGAWRIYVLVAGDDFSRGGLDPANILLLPAWTAQSLSGILSALTGLNYNFAGGWIEPTAFAGPTLAVVFMIAIGWRISRGRTSPVFWAVMAIAGAMFISQVLSWIPDIREPGTSRYLYPGALVVLIVAVEAAARYRVSRNVLIAAWLVALAGFGSNLMIIRDSGAALRDRSPLVELQMTAATLVNHAGFFFPGPEAVPLQNQVESPAVSIIGSAAEKYGGLGVDGPDIPDQSPSFREGVDKILIDSIDPYLQPMPAREKPRDCRPASAFGEGTWLTELPTRGATLTAKRDATLKIWRFADSPSNTVGILKPGRPQVLALPDDGDDYPWKLISDAPFEVCDLPAT